MSTKEEVYISYSWSTKEEGILNSEYIINRIEKILQKDFTIVIDRKSLRYKSKIKEFEQRLAKGNKIILIISDKYLKSEHCMYEALLIQEYGNIYDRVFPIVLSDASSIYTSITAIDYISYWENKVDTLEKKLKKLKSQANTTRIRTDIDNFTRIRAMFDDFSSFLSNMNTLNPEKHKDSNFKELVSLLKGNNSSTNKNTKRDYSNKINLTKELFEKAISIVKKEIKNENIKADEILEKLCYYYEQCKNQSFQIAVMAMVKSGKSTFLNSLLGEELLPMSNVPETSIPIKINHSHNDEVFLQVGEKKIYGALKIKSFITSKNSEKRQVGIDTEEEYNLYAPFQTLKEKDMLDVKFEIIDTPGFGEALKLKTIGKSINQSNDELIDKISAVIYLLDYSKLNTQEEKEVIDKLSSLRPDILEKIKDRLFFIINQIDKEDRHSLTPEKAVGYVLDLVREKIPDLNKEHILLLSARNALLARLIIKGNATSEARNDFGKIAFGGSWANKATSNDYIVAANEYLNLSFIVDIEDKIISYLYDNRSRIFLEGLLDNLKRVLIDYKNKFVMTAQGTLNKTIQEIEDLEIKIGEAKKKQENIQNEANNFEKEVKEWIEDEFKGFEKSILDDIDSAFNSEKAIEKQSLSRKPLSKFVKKVQGFLKEAFNKGDDSSKEDIEKLIKDINIKIHQELSESFVDFKGKLEQKILDKQSFLFDNLKTTINSLARDFEATLKKALHINLEIVELNIDMLDFDKVLNDADSFIERFIKSSAKIKDAIKEERVYNNGSWCESGYYETRYVVVPELILENHINKYGIELHWKHEIEQMNSNAKKITIQLIENNIKTQIKNARNSFNSYVDDYLTTIHEQKIKLSKNSKEEIKERLTALKKIDEDLSLIINKTGIIYSKAK